MKKILALVIILTLLTILPAYGSTGMDYLSGKSLTDESNNYRSLAMVTKTLSALGVDTANLKTELGLAGTGQDLQAQAFRLLAASEGNVAAWVASSQTDGAWDSDVYLTALLTYVLEETSLESSSAQDGAAYLRVHPNDDGGWGNDSNSEAADTALALLALAKSGSNDKTVQNGLDWLLLNQGGEGGWGNQINTAWSCMALQELGTNPDELEDALDYLKLLTNQDGGWGIYPGEASDPFTSALVILVLQKSDATAAEVATGLAYLQQVVNDETWVSKALAFYNITEICHLLENDSNGSSLKTGYGEFLQELTEQGNYDYLARKISLTAGNGEDPAELVAELLARQNSDGGWGFGEGCSSDPWDTALVLRALLDVGCADFTVYQKLVTYFSSCQNSDGSFSSKKGESGQVYLTAVIAEELDRLNSVLDCSYYLNLSCQWLAGQRRDSGGYGDGILETARALRIIAWELSSSDLETTLSYMSENQLTNGSWNDDSLTTAAVLSIFNKVKPDLTVEAADLAFSPETAYLSATIAMTVTVHNSGLTTAENIPVRLYQGTPETGALLGMETVAALAPQQAGTATFSWEATATGTQQFTAVIDETGQVDESDETNNQAAKILNVLPKVDLEILADDIEITPDDPSPTDTLTIKAKVRNLGYLDSGAFTVLFYNGDPQGGGTLVGSALCTNVAGQSVSEVSCTIQLAVGEYRIYAVADSDNQVTEDSESNNQSNCSLSVAKRIDLAISYHNIILSKDEPLEGDKIFVYATIANKREEAVTSVPVAFYLGNPDTDGVLLGTEICAQISGNSTALVQFSWDTTGISGRQLLYVVVDPENTIKEVDKTNNQALQVIYLTARPDLSCTVSASAMTEGTPGTLSVSVKNQGGSEATDVKVSIYLGDLTSGQKLWDDLTLATIAAAGTSSFSVTLDTVNRGGTQQVSVQVDPDNTVNEIDETNNSATTSFTVNPPVELEVSGDNLTSSPQTVANGDSLTLNAIVTNTHTTKAQNVIVRLYRKVEDEWSAWGEQAVTVAGNGQTTVSFLLGTDYQVGTNSYQVVIDPDGNLYERDKTNNSATKDFEVNEATKADLVIEDACLVTEPTVVSRDSQCVIRTTVKNLRTVQADEVTVRFYNGDPAFGGTAIGEQVIQVPGLGGTVAKITWDTSNLQGYIDLYVWVDPEDTIAEYDDTNNTASNLVPLRAAAGYQPQKLNAVVDYNNVTLSWDAVTADAVSGYLVYRDGGIINSSNTDTHGTVTASSVYSTSSSYAATNAIDGNTGTYWHSKYGTSHWIEEEFSAYQFVEQIVIQWYSTPVNYQVQIWDGEAYRTVATVSGNTDNPSTCQIGGHGLFIKKYRIVVTNTSNFYAIIKEITVTTREANQSLSYQDTALPSGNYEYCVSSLNGHGEESLPSAPVEVSVLPPDAPTGFTAEVQGPNAILSWKASPATDCQGYYLKRDDTFLGETESSSGSAAAFASWSSSYGPEKAVDGNSSSFWYYYSSSSKTGWWQMDLPLKRYVSTVTINWYYTPSEFEILYWQNNKWVQIASVQNNQSATNAIILDGVYKADKIRVNITKPYTSGSYSYYGIKEIAFQSQKLLTALTLTDKNLKAATYQYRLTAENSLACESDPLQLPVTVLPPQQPTGVTAVADGANVTLSWTHQQETGFAGYYITRNDHLLTAGLDPADVAVSGSATASSCISTSHQPSNALDRNTSTYWHSTANNFPISFIVQLQAIKVISGIKIAWYSSSYSAKNFLIQYKQDNQWVTIQSVTGASASEGTYDFAHAVKTDAVRLYCSRGNGSYLIIREIYVYEKAPLTEMSYVDESLADGTYSYCVIAADQAGNWSEPSLPATATIGTVLAPQNLQATVIHSSVSLKWEMASMDGIAGFYVYRDRGRLNEPENVASECTVQVSANANRASYLTDNNTSSYWYPGYNVYPATIEMNATGTMKLSEIKLQWHSAAPTDYKIWAWKDEAWALVEEVTDAGLSKAINLPEILKTEKIKVEIVAGPNYVYLAELQLFDINVINDLSFVDTVAENRIYTYYVTALSDHNGMSGASNSISVAIDEKVAPAQPSGFTVTEQNGSLLLKWIANTESDLAGYTIYLEDATEPLTSKLSAIQYTYTLPAGKDTFDFKLYAVDVNGNQSDPATASLTLTEPATPTNIQATSNKLNVTLSWIASTGLNVKGYKIYRNGNLINTLSRISPATVNAASYYCNNSNYQPGNAADQSSNTFWRPGLADQNSYIEIHYSSLQLISAIGMVWHSRSETPTSYSVAAWVNGSWQTLITKTEVSGQTVVLPGVVVTECLRLTVDSADKLISLSEFNGYTATLRSSPYTDQSLTPGTYSYEVTAVNIAGLESVKSQTTSVEITTRDLELLTGDLYYTPYNASVFDNITLSVNVKNSGTVAVSSVPVALYAGDPDNGGSLIASLTASDIQPGAKSLVQYVWVPTGFAGEQTIYAVIDPDGEIAEYDESNNSCSIDLTIMNSQQLETSVVSVDSSAFPSIKIAVQVNDSLGEGVAGLGKTNFTVLENDVEQTILNLTSQIDDTSEIAKIDLVFIVDASGSMSDEWNYLPGIIADLTDTLTETGIDIDYKVYSLQYVYNSAVNHVEALTKGIYQGNEISVSSECWGPGTAWVAKNYSWRDGAYRIVIPISDENCYQGSNETAEDLASIAEATEFCAANDVEAYPFYGFSDTSASVKSEMQSLADGTGGEMFYFEDAIQVVNYLTRVLSQKKVHYNIEYQTSNLAKDGTLREVLVDTSYREAEGSGHGQYTAPQDTYADLCFSGFSTETISSEGQSVNLKVIIQNKGGVLAENIQIAVYLGNPSQGGILLNSQTINTLAPNNTVALDIPWTTVPGTYQFYAVVDPDNQIVELNEANNAATMEVQVPGAQFPDLLISDRDVTLSSAAPSCGQKVEISVRVHNMGSASRSFEVGFYQGDPQSGGKLIATQKVASLDYLGYRDLVCNWITPIVSAEVNIYVVIDPLNSIEESNETNNSIHKTVQVSEHPVSGRIATDKSGYDPNENILLSLIVTNRQSESWSGTAAVIIKDLQDNIIEELTQYEISGLLGDSGNGPGEWTQSQVWNVGSLTSGKYLACLELTENGDRFTEFNAEFEVYANRKIDGNLTTNKTVYTPNQRAIITVDFSNESVNNALEDLTVKVAVGNQAGEVWSEEIPVAVLPISSEQTGTFNWPVATNAVGDYEVVAEITCGTETLWSATKQVQVDSTVAMSGSLTVDPKKGRVGNTLNLTYSLQNHGNVSIDEALTEILFVSPETEKVVKVISKDCALEWGEEKTENLTEIIQLEDGQYMVVLRTTVDGTVIPLSSGSLLVDSTPPVTSWKLSDQRLDKDGILYGVLSSKLTLNAADNLSGVAETVIDQGDGYETYTGPITFSEGKHTIKYKSIDCLNNEESVHVLTVIIDETPPEVVIVAPVDNQEVTPEFTVNLTASDNVGLDYYELYINDLKYADYSESPREQTLQLKTGEYTLKARAVDLAGYESWSDTVKITVVDTTPPVTVADYPGDWINQDVVVTLTATDDYSGVKATYYRIDGGEWLTGTELQIRMEGIHTVDFYSVDHAGNLETVKTITTKIDKIKPLSQIILAGIKVHDHQKRVFHFPVDKRFDYPGDKKGGSVHGKIKPHNTVQPIDKKGDCREDQRQDYNYGVRMDGGVFQSDVTVTLMAKDNPKGSGVANIFYRMGETGSDQIYTGPLVISEAGTYAINFYANDHAGNIEPVKRLKFKIVKALELDYSLICNRLTVSGKFDADRVFVNGPVNINGNCHLGYLGTTEKTIRKTGPSVIKKLMTEQPYQTIPDPDWEGLNMVTALRKEKQLPRNVTLADVRFENGLMIAGTVKLSGVIVVKGDLTINGNVDLNKAGIYCSGKIVFNGNVKGSGLIYAGTGLRLQSVSSMNGTIIVNGPAQVAGVLRNEKLLNKIFKK